MRKLIYALVSIFFVCVQSKVTKLKIADEEGGADWILEIEDDVIKDQYREGDLPIKVRANQKGEPWPGGVVPYALSPKYTDQEKQKIVNALNHIGQQMNNCVRYVPRTNQPDYVFITKTDQGDNGCNSAIGKSPRGGPQTISLDSACLTPHAIIHEATHALGFDHTQCRSDRDKFVDVLWNNIKPGFEHNFKTKETNNQLVGFDYESILIYSPKSFSKNGQPTMQPKDPVKYRLYEDNERNELSRLDKEMIRRLYQCR